MGYSTGYVLDEWNYPTKYLLQASIITSSKLKMITKNFAS